MPFYSYSYLYLLCIDELSNFLFFVTIFQYSLTWYCRNARFTCSIHSLNTHPAIAVTQERNDLRVRMLLFIIVVLLPIFHVADPIVSSRLHGLLHRLVRASGAVFGPEYDCFLRFGTFCDHWIHSIRLLPSDPHPVHTTHYTNTLLADMHSFPFKTNEDSSSSRCLGWWSPSRVCRCV